MSVIEMLQFMSDLYQMKAVIKKICCLWGYKLLN